MISGHPNLVNIFKEIKAKGVVVSKLTATERLACDPSPEPDCIVEVGAYTFYDAGDKRVDDGKYFLMWTRTADGSGYKQLYDTFSSNIKAE